MRSDCPPTSRPFVVKLLILLKGSSIRLLGERTGRSKSGVGNYLNCPTLPEDVFNELVEALGASPAEVTVVTGFHEALLSLNRPCAFPGEREIVESTVLSVSRWCRDLVGEVRSLALAEPLLAKYPLPWEVEPSRWRAATLLDLLKKLNPRIRLKAAAIFTPLHTWAVVEAVVEESVKAASRSPREALHWARIARQIAKRIDAHAGWQKRIQALAVGAFANALRVAGRLFAAERALEAAKRLWNEGYDPIQILDPGWLLSFEASLRRAQRRLREALDCLDQARLVSRNPARILIKKGFTLEVMGESEQAVAALSEAMPLVDADREPQLWYKSRLQLAVNLCNLSRYREAADLVKQAGPVAARLGDKLDLLRLSWLVGRIHRGLGHTRDALRHLEKAERAFADRGMWLDVALALLERASVLLQDGRKAEARAVSGGLIEVFKTQGVHREAMAALRLFYDTVQGGTATLELAQEVVCFLLRARHDPGLRFRS